MACYFTPCDPAKCGCKEYAQQSDTLAAMSSAAIQNALIESVIDYGRACADELPESERMWLDDVREKVEGIQQNAYAEGRKDAEEEIIPVPPKALELLVQAMEYGHDLWHGVSKEDSEGMGFNLKFGIKEYLQEVGYLMKDKK